MSKNRLLASAQKYISKGQYRKAIGEYEKILKEDPADFRARLKLADLYFREQMVDKAVGTYVEVAELYERDGFTLKAVAVYKQVLKVAPVRHDLYVALASNYQKLGLLNDAGAQYREALKLLDDQGDQLGKLHVIRQILELDPDNLPDRLRLAEAYSALGQMSQAVRDFREVAQALEKLGMEEDFRRVAERLLYHQPDDAAAAQKLAASYVRAGQPQRALPKLRVAFRNAPRDLEVLRTLAEAFNQLGQIHKTVTVLKEMARLYGKSGLDRERADCLQQVLMLSPGDREAREVLGRVDAPSSIDGAEIVFEDGGGAEVAPPPVPPPAASPPPPPAASPPPPPSAPGPAAAPARAASPSPTEQAGAMISAMITDALGDEAQAAQSGARTDDVGDDELQALFNAAMTELEGPAAAPPAQAAPAPSTGDDFDDFDDDLGDFDDDDDDDDEIGFGSGLSEQTIVDNEFIPSDVMNQAGSGFGLSVPEEPSAAQSRETFAKNEALLREELEELDFYIQTGLADEAEALLTELQGRWGDHDYVRKRTDEVRRMR